MKENKRKCFRCGSSPGDNLETKLYRFPKPSFRNVERCHAWAKYCFPDKQETSVEFHKKLYAEHRMLCHRHFESTEFVDYQLKKLKQNAIPGTHEENIHHLSVQSAPSQPLMDITNVAGPSGVRHIIEKNISIDTTTELKSQAKFIACTKYLKRMKLLNKRIGRLNNKNFLEELSIDKAVNMLSRNISPTFAILLQSQLRNFKKSPKGRRWSSNDKITALRLFKRSPTCYRLLRRMFCLPSPTTLKGLLSKCLLHVGINTNIFKVIGNYVKAQKSIDNQYILMFDEMAIKKHFEYNAKKDIIDGYQDHGFQGRSPQPASYALVFMIAGIRKKIKQPLAYYLSGPSVNADRLAVLIKEVLGECQKHKINIAATVCDMDGVNRRAMSILGATSSNPYFELNGQQVVTLFDTPHLVKCFRNLFLKYPIECPTNISSEGVSGTGIAKWSHIIKFHEVDVSSGANFVFAPCLKQEHLNPNSRQKMKVKLAVQVLSHTVAAGMYAKIAKGDLPADAVVTADLIARMDSLFDSLNSDTSDLKGGKPLATNMKASSPHVEFLNEMKIFFCNIKFIGCARIPPSQEGWLWTLNGVLRLWDTFTKKHKAFKSLSTRRLQQDPLENLFGCIRSNCGANYNPTAVQFVAGLKTALISNLSHLGGGNCELDSNQTIIENFKLLIKTNNPQIELEEQLCSKELKKTIPVQAATTEDMNETEACAYVCGFLLKNLKNDCSQCKSILITDDRLALHTFVQFKEYYQNKECLNYASRDFVLCVELCATEINTYLESNANKQNLLQHVFNYLEGKINFDFLKPCTNHFNENIAFIINNVFHIIVKRFCIKKNMNFVQEAASVALKRKMKVLTHT